MMTFIKEFWKSSLFGALGTLIYNGLPTNTTQEVIHANNHNTTKPTPPTKVRDEQPIFIPQIKRGRTNTRHNRVLKILDLFSPYIRIPSDHHHSQQTSKSALTKYIGKWSLQEQCTRYGMVKKS